jgi:hypothetical protein
MKKLKKFKRFSQGGLGSSEGYGDPFANKTEFEPGRGEKNLEGIKDFFGFGKKKPAPTEERDTSNRAPEPVKAEPVKAEPAKTSPVKTPSVAQQMADREKGGPNERANYASSGKTSRPEYDSYSYGPDYLADGNEGVDSFTSTGNAKKAEEYRQSLMSGNKPKPAAPKAAEKDSRDMEKGMSRGRTESGPPVFSTPPRRAKPEDIPTTEASKGPKGELIDNSNLPAKQFAQSMLGATAVGRVVSPAIRGAAMVGRMLESPRAEGKGTGKIPEEKPEISVPKTPAVERVKAAKIEGPPASAAPKTPAQQMGLRETEPMRRAREAKEKFEAAGKSAKEAADKSSKNAADEVAAEAAKRAASKRQTPDNRRFPNKGSATPGRPKARAEFKPTGNKFDRPVGEKRGPKTDEVLEREGLPKKKGGKIPAFKKGGLVGRADGCAIRGKTKGRMV